MKRLSNHDFRKRIGSWILTFYNSRVEKQLKEVFLVPLTMLSAVTNVTKLIGRWLHRLACVYPYTTAPTSPQRRISLRSHWYFRRFLWYEFNFVVCDATQNRQFDVWHVTMKKNGGAVFVESNPQPNLSIGPSIT